MEGLGLIHVAVLEIEPEGHRLAYARHLMSAATDATLMTSARAVSSAEYRTHLADHGAAVVALPDGLPRGKVLATAVDLSVEAGASRLVVPDGDHHLLPLLRLALRRRLPLPVSLLVMRTTVPRRGEPLSPAVVAKPLLVQALRLFRRAQVRFLTDAFGVVRRRAWYPGIDGVRDPVEPPSSESLVPPAWFPAPRPGTVTVGVFGVISGRKNLPVLVDALTILPEMVVVVGGRLEPEVRELVESDAARQFIDEGRLVVHDLMLGADEFGPALTAVDVVAVLHDNDAPSGILAEACARHTPVVVPAGGWLARVVDSTGVGESTTLDATSVATAVRRLASDLAGYVRATRRHARTLGTTHFASGLLGP